MSSRRGSNQTVYGNPSSDTEMQLMGDPSASLLGTVLHCTNIMLCLSGGGTP